MTASEAQQEFTAADLFAALDRLTDRGFCVQALSLSGSGWIIDALRAVLPADEFAARSEGRRATSAIDAAEVVEIADALKTILGTTLVRIGPGKAVVPDELVGLVKEASMARRRNDDDVVEISLDPKAALQLLGKQLERLRTIKGSGQPVTAEVWRPWYASTEDIVNKARGSTSQQARAFHAVGRPFSTPLNPSPAWLAAMYTRFVDQAIASLESIVEAIETELSVAAAVATPAATPDIAPSRTVFIVHGHDDGARETTARFLSKLGLVPIILFEQPNRGDTIIEKVLRHADVAFAIVLMTGDDRGGARDVPYEDQRPRARQNVIAELGFFVAHLGRGHVAAIVEDGIEIPSDFSGVAYIPLDKRGAWMMDLAREINAAGVSIDLNKAM